ncbi:hypothetical protein CRE_22568 [Caenorhabditis remanei]|uniref:Uncharacterized protein n=2 Tax=Caenorhabditis remanei TaxID=31234 RepID=E3N387_CAERE|nr:hypothetical protein CRE_22568 [Caenorhabditis remanei]
MPSFHILVILLLLATTIVSSFILQDLPLERFERSGGHDELFAPQQFERHSRSGHVYRPGGNFWQRYRYRMMSG